MRHAKFGCVCFIGHAHNAPFTQSNRHTSPSLIVPGGRAEQYQNP